MRSIRYNLEYLNKIISEYNANLLDRSTFINYNFTYNSKINYKCNCGEIALRTFKQIETLGAYCKKCIKINSEIKRKETLLQKYGKEHLQQIKKFKEKRILNNIEKYGVENVIQANEFKNKAKATTLQKYGKECFLLTEEYKEKCKLTLLNKYGVDNINKIEGIKEKAKNTNLLKYGSIYPTQTKQIKNKIKITNFIKYGEECYLNTKEFDEKKKYVCLERYGYEDPSKSDIVKEKIKNTNLQKYGVTSNLHAPHIKQKYMQNNFIKYGSEFPMQNDEIVSRSFNNAFRLKDYTLPSGKIIKYMGYENKALDILLHRYNINEDDIINDIKQVPKIWYLDMEVKRKYIPDIFIKSQNKIIEVKSKWTFDKNYDCNIEKAKACKNIGYYFEFWIFNDDKDIHPTIIVM